MKYCTLGHRCSSALQGTCSGDVVWYVWCEVVLNVVYVVMVCGEVSMMLYVVLINEWSAV